MNKLLVVRWWQPLMPQAEMMMSLSRPCSRSVFHTASTVRVQVPRPIVKPPNTAKKDNKRSAKTAHVPQTVGVIWCSKFFVQDEGKPKKKPKTAARPTSNDGLSVFVRLFVGF